MATVQAASSILPLSTADAARGSGILEQQDFLEIMIAELSNQDPFEPLDNREFLGQLTQMQTLQATTALTEGLGALLLGQQLSSAGALIGLDVRGAGPDGGAVAGTVDRVLVVSGEVMLGVGSSTLPLSGVLEVTAPAAAEETAA